MKGSDQKNSLIINPLITEIAIIEVQSGKKNKPDKFCALIQGISKDDPSEAFASQWSFVRQGDWWLLDQVRS